MNPHLALLQKLEQHPELLHSETPGRLRIEPMAPNGFAVELHGNGNKWAVHLGEAGFHEIFLSADEVLNFISWCYSGDVRIRELWRGATPQTAILEAVEDGEWREVSRTGNFFVPFWQQQREVLLRNPNLLRNLT
ncbi:MAG: hypothetical protein ACOYLS_12280 [Polymorphobacter sp.]